MSMMNISDLNVAVINTQNKLQSLADSLSTELLAKLQEELDKIKAQIAEAQNSSSIENQKSKASIAKLENEVSELKALIKDKLG